MAKQQPSPPVPADKTEADPQAGGSYTRDPDTGALTRTVEPDIAATGEATAPITSNQE